MLAFLCGECVQLKRETGIERLDTLLMGKGITVHTNTDISSVSDKDFKEICSAIGRTPHIDHEIVKISMIPDKYTPGAACVMTQHDIVYLSHGNNGEWHVFRISGYAY